MYDKPLNKIEKKVIINDLLLKLSNTMNEKHFKMIEERFVQGFTGKEMAMRYKKSVGCIESTLSQAKNKGRKIVIDLGFNEQEIYELLE